MILKAQLRSPNEIKLIGKKYIGHKSNPYFNKTKYTLEEIFFLTSQSASSKQELSPLNDLQTSALFNY